MYGSNKDCKNRCWKIWALLALLLAFPMVHQAQNVTANSKPRLSVELDPATFLFKGFGLHLRLQPHADSHLLMGLGAYAMDMPRFLVDLNPDNKGQGWQVRLNQGYGFFVERYFREVNEKWFVGGQLGVQQFKLENEFEAGSSKYVNLLAMAYGGYVWRPFDFPLYFKPWAGIGYVPKIGGESHLGELGYSHSPITYFATLHVGYTF